MTGGPWFDDRAREVVAAALDAQVPGASELGAVDYVERLLTALEHDPPRVWAAPEGSGFSVSFHELRGAGRDQAARVTT